MCVYEVKTYACMAAQYSDGTRHPFGFWMVFYHSSQAGNPTSFMRRVERIARLEARRSRAVHVYQ
jgi:hypothetical protein